MLWTTEQEQSIGVLSEKAESRRLKQTLCLSQYHYVIEYTSQKKITCIVKANFCVIRKTDENCRSLFIWLQQKLKRCKHISLTTLGNCGESLGTSLKTAPIFGSSCKTILGRNYFLAAQTKYTTYLLTKLSPISISKNSNKF